MSDNPQKSAAYAHEIAPPPRALKWLIWTMIVLVVLALIGGIVGVYAFREWVPPRYQVTLSDQFPILTVLLPPRPDANTVLPPPEVTEGESSVSLDDLLGLTTTEESNAEEAASTNDSNAAADTEEPVVTEEPLETEEVAPTAEGDAAAAEVAVVPSPTAIPPTPIPTATLLPQPTPIPAAETVNTSGSSLPRPPVNARNFGFQYVQQTWNNCGPANVTMSLSYYGWQEDQTYAQNYLRGNREDKNVSPHEIVNFVNDQTGVRAAYRIGGDMDTLKRLIAAGFPLMVELGYAPEGNDWLGHYQTVVGYDDSIGSLYVMDSYIPSDLGLPVTYSEFDRDWQQFTRTFIVFYPREREGEVMQLLGPLADTEDAYRVALETAQREVRENPQNGYALFNLGRAHTRLGNYEAASAAFDRARLHNLPWRMSWYQFEPFEAYFETGRYGDVLALVDSNIATLGGGFVEETFYWQGRVFEVQGDNAAAASAFRRAIQQNGRYTAARNALERVS
jgi:tetratricopeptide (TPR) repeat protein